MKNAFFKPAGLLFALALAVPIATQAAWQKIDNFNNYDNSSITTIGANSGGDATSGVWDGIFDGTANARIYDDPTQNDGGTNDNLLEIWGVSSQTTAGWRGAKTDLGNNFSSNFTLADHTTNTVFFQFKPLNGAGTFDCMMGLSDTIANVDNNNSWQEFAVMPFLSGGGIGAAAFKATTTNGDVAAITNVLSQWYNVWLVIDTEHNTYDVYTSTGTDAGTLGVKDAIFRNGLGTGSLAVLGFAQDQDNHVDFDNIYITPGVDTSNPLASSVAPSPYTPDANTLFLFHLDEASGGSVTTNVGSLGGNAYTVIETNAPPSPPLVNDVLGAPGYTGFGNAATFAAGELIGFDYNNNGQYDGDGGSGALSADSLPMSALNMGNGGQTPWTLEALISPSSINTNNQEIICTDSSATERGFQFRISNNGYLQFDAVNLSTTPQIQARIPTSGSNAFVPGDWYHAAVTYDGTNLNLYWTKVDSPATAANLIAGPVAATIGTSFGSVQGPLVIGNENRNVAGEYFQGRIDEVRISDVARAANQMLFLTGGSISASATAISPANPVYAGTPVTLSSFVWGTQPINYVWQSDGGTGGGPWTNLPNSTTNTYSLDTSALPPGTYQYRLVVSDATGSATNTPAALNLLAASGPVLASDTTISPSSTVVGSPVSFSASFSGTPPIYYQWYFIANGGGTNAIVGATNTTFILASAQTNNAGSYFLMASNNPPGLGSQVALSSPATLTLAATYYKPSTGMFCDLLEHPEETVITASTPTFGWFYQPSFRNDYQTGYRIIVASSQALADADTGDMWDSDWVKSSNSINVVYGGSDLQPSTSYYWRVQTLDSLGRTNVFSAVQQFNMASQLSDPLTTGGVVYQQPSGGSANCYPLRYVPVRPVLVTNTSPGVWFVDFGKDGFGYATENINGNYSGTTVGFGLGEAANGYSVNTSPGATIRYRSGSYSLQNGDVIYTNRSTAAVGTISPPAATYGIVSPFRYLQLSGVPAGVILTSNNVTQWRLETEFDPTAATFNSSSATLNQVWNLCHYSMEALTFDGIYVDGDRERKPYEADAFIQQMSSYGADNQFMLPRCTFEYLTSHLTWPTEWPMHMVFAAWADYQQTGNPYLITKYYGFLTNQFRMNHARSDGLISGVTMGSQPGDLVDWPAADRDGYVWEPYDAELNAFYYRCLTIMTKVAQVTGHATDATNFAAKASQVYSSYDAAFWSTNSQCYVDGEGTTHISVHGNFFPLAFGLVPTNKQAAVVSYLDDRAAANGMIPSVYGAQYMLQGMFMAGDSDTALALMGANTSRSWMNMINIGSTITCEAWSIADKANEDWNHAWGAAPGNLIPRFVLGVRPLAAGYDRILVQPHLGSTLSFVQGMVPTIRGPVSVVASNAPGQFQLWVNIPGNVAATVMLPATNTTAIVDGAVVSGTLSTDSLSHSWLTVTNIGSGQHAIWTCSASSPSTNTLYSNWASSWFGTNVANPDIAGQTADPDGDGMSNYREFIAGTNPLDSTDYLHITGLSYLSGAEFDVTVNGHTGRRYTLQSSLALNPASWSDADTQAATSENQAITLRDWLAAGTSSLFFRLLVAYP